MDKNKRRLQLYGKPQLWSAWLDARQSQLRFSSLAKMRREYFNYCLYFWNGHDTFQFLELCFEGTYGPHIAPLLVYAKNPLLNISQEDRDIWNSSSYTAFPYAQAIGPFDEE